MNETLSIKPEVWIPHYGLDFERSTKGWKPSDKWSYWAAICAYWYGECLGLTNEDDSLRRICECDLAEWARVRGLIFGPKFKLQSGLWHNRRAHLEYDRAKSMVEARQARGKAAAEARWGKEPDANAMLEDMPKQCVGHHLSDTPSPSPSQYTDQPSHTPSPSDGASVGAVAQNPNQLAASIAALKRPQDDSGLLSFKEDLSMLYSRPVASPWAYDEECLLAEIHRRPDWKAEYSSIKAHLAKLEPRYKPALRRLLEGWTSYVDRARVVKGAFGPPQSEVTALCKEKWPTEPEALNWAVSFHAYWTKRDWKQRNGTPIDWKVELSKQVSKWRVVVK